jgi:hypothetical protein
MIIPTWLKMVGLAIFCGSAIGIVSDWNRLRGVDHDRKQCVAAVADGNDLKPCPAPIVRAVDEARRARACDDALQSGDLYPIQGACSAAVKLSDAQRRSAQSDAQNLAEQLHQAAARSAEAVTRAESRATASSTRKARSDDAISRTPTGDDGLRSCDARCLRDLAGDAGH